MSLTRMSRLAISATGALFVLSIFMGLSAGIGLAQCPNDEFTQEFPLWDCHFETTGENPYFKLTPGYQLVLEGEEDGVQIRLEVTVLWDKEWIDLAHEGIGMVETRVVEEREYEDGELVEVSRNFFALCEETNSVYYFGEDVDDYEGDVIVGNEGAWRAGENGAMPGLMMPGTFLLGSRYYQEQAPGMAMDRAQNVEMGLTTTTEAGTFYDCVRVEETSALDPCDFSEKIYCPGVGLIVDDAFELTGFGQVDEEGKLCAILGKDGFRRDEDIFRFSGNKGETVTVRLEADPPESGSGKMATLILQNKTGGFWLLFRRQARPLPHEITATLPLSGEYHVTVAERLRAPWGHGYNGDYCLTLAATPETSQTFEALCAD